MLTEHSSHFSSTERKLGTGTLLTRKLVYLTAVLVAFFCRHAHADLTWWFDFNNSTPDVSDSIINRITDSMDIAVATYNAYSDYDWSHVAGDSRGIRVIYQQSVPTANASYRGRIAFGGSRSPHTAMHEMAHVLGVGTFRRWDNASLRDSTTRSWLGEAALAEVQDINNNPDSRLNADGAHFWPYGLNGNDGNRQAHVRMVGALREDMQLANTTTWNSDLPVLARYTFNSDLTSSDTHPTSQASDVMLGSKILHSTVTNTLRSEGNDPLNNTFADAEANGFTSEFSLTTTSPLDLDSLYFVAQFNEMETAETGTLVLRSSADQFQSDLVSISNEAIEGTSDLPVRVDLTDFDDVTDVTFRFYFLGENDAAAERTRISGPITLFGADVTLAGDFDDNDDVDRNDLDVWEAGFATEYDGGDFLKWQRSFMPSQRLQAVEAVPEPSSLLSILSAVLIGGGVGRRNHR